MGRTNPTYRMVLRGIEDQWEPYRRALRRSHQPHFDRLFEHAREHADASGYLNHEEPMYSVLVSIALEHERHIAALEEHVSTLEAELQDDE